MWNSSIFTQPVVTPRFPAGKLAGQTDRRLSRKACNTMQGWVYLLFSILNQASSVTTFVTTVYFWNFFCPSSGYDRSKRACEEKLTRTQGTVEWSLFMKFPIQPPGEKAFHLTYRCSWKRVRWENKLENKELWWDLSFPSMHLELTAA